MSLSIGIVGFPNAGKSTLFNALLGRAIAQTAAYAFCTIEPNVGVVPVPDDRLTALAKIVNPEKITPAVVKFIDIAGLVKGAAKGEGLGNKFLAHIREVDCICFVLRAFESKDVDKAGSSHPREDLENLKAELILKDLETIEKFTAPVKDLPAKQQLEQLKQKLITNMNKGLMVKDIHLTDEEIEFIKPLNFLTFKPYFIILNVNEQDLANIEKIIADYKDWTIIPISAKIEEELANLDTQEQKEYLKTLGLAKSGLERLIKTAYDYLGLISFLTARPKEVRAWTIKKDMLAPEAAGVIHTDFAKNFIKVKVISFSDFIAFSGWQKAKELGKVRMEGRDYKIKDGEVVEFMVGK